MRYAGPVRRKLGIRTIFNLLGPLTNPAGARRQVLGTCKPELTETLARVLAARNASFAWVVHGHNGLCDITITGATQVTELTSDKGGKPIIRTFTVHPEDVGLPVGSLEELLVDTPRSSALAIKSVIQGEERGASRNHALLNAGAALLVAGLCPSFPTAVQLAAETIDSGAAARKLDQFIALSRDH